MSQFKLDSISVPFTNTQLHEVWPFHKSQPLCCSQSKHHYAKHQRTYNEGTLSMANVPVKRDVFRCSDDWMSTIAQTDQVLIFC